MLELQQNLLQTRNKVESFSSELKAKDNVIENQNKSISALQSQIADLQQYPQSQPQPGSVAYHHHHTATPQHPGLPGVHPSGITPGGPAVPSLYSVHPALSEHSASRAASNYVSPPPAAAAPFEPLSSSSDTIPSRHSYTPRRKRTYSHDSHHRRTHSHGHSHGHHPMVAPKLRHSQSSHYEHDSKTIRNKLSFRQSSKQRHSSCPIYEEEYDLIDLEEFPLRGDRASHSMGCLNRQESQESYRSDSGGSPRMRPKHNMRENEYEFTEFDNVPSLAFPSSAATRSMPVSHRQKLSKSRGSRILDRSRSHNESTVSDHSSSRKVSKDKHRKTRKARKSQEAVQRRMIIYAFGCNENGELGLGHNENLSQVTRLPFTDQLKIANMYYGMFCVDGKRIFYSVSMLKQHAF